MAQWIAWCCQVETTAGCKVHHKPILNMVLLHKLLNSMGKYCKYALIKSDIEDINNAPNEFYF